MNKNIFEIIILNGRPAAGKSEVIDYLKNVPVAERIEKFHIGEFEEIDDFPILWEQFEDDDILEKMGLPRLISNPFFEYKGKKYDGHVFKEKWYWNFLIKKINFIYWKKLKEDPGYHNNKTAIIEFSRGSEHGGFTAAYDHLSDEILKKSATLYIDVTWEESLKKNRRRYNPDKPDSILEHALEDIKIEKLYKGSDWKDFITGDKDFIHLSDHRIPYGVFDNMPEKTDDPAKIGPHLEDVLNKVWKIYSEK